MTASTTPLTNPAVAERMSPKEQFLDSYEREHERTMRVLRAFPTGKLDMQPHPRCKSARELAFIFVLERGLGTKAYNGQLAAPSAPGTKPPTPPESWEELLGALERAHRDFGDLVRSTPDEKFFETVKFFVAPKTLGDVPRIDLLWFLLMDQIHHRGQFSIYLRMADGKVPSIYGPSGDEPWN